SDSIGDHEVAFVVTSHVVVRGNLAGFGCRSVSASFRSAGLEWKRPPGGPAGVQPFGGSSVWRRRPSSLLQRGRNGLELRQEVRADGGQDGDDHHRNETGDQAIFDGRRARLVTKERTEFRHRVAPHSVACRVTNVPCIRGYTHGS